MGEFHPRQGDGGGSEGLEAEHRSTAPLNGPMILFDDVVEIATLANDDRTPLRVFIPQQAKRYSSRHVPIEIDLTGPALRVGINSLAKKGPCGVNASIRPQDHGNSGGK